MSSKFAFPTGLARAFAGAIIFSLPLMMTMEMWSLGVSMDPLRLGLLLIATVPLLTGLSYHAGFEETFNWREDLMDALAAYAVSFVTSAVILTVFGLITHRMVMREIIGMVCLQAVPASIGAVLARAQLGSKSDDKQTREGQTSYGAELFHMAAGALFLAFNVAPTEEIIVISIQMTPWHAVALALLSIAIMHAFVYTVEFRGHEPLPEGSSRTAAFFRFTIAGYAIALGISAAILWTFGRIDGLAIRDALIVVMVLGFPAAIGAAAARLIL